MNNKLGVVIPYRHREEHLSILLPHLSAYLATRFAARILVVQQEDGGPFNRGLLCNIGFQLLCDEIDYVCFHDVDYLPVDADYSDPAQPAMIIWYGMERRPLDTADHDRYVDNPLHLCFSAVIVVRSEHVIAVNGHAVDYWGWGWEDLDFKNRLEAIGLQTVHRKGTFRPLDHVHAGYSRDGSPSEAHSRNAALFWTRWKDGYDWRTNGLNSTHYVLLEKTPLQGVADVGVELVRVKFPLPTAI